MTRSSASIGGFYGRDLLRRVAVSALGVGLALAPIYELEAAPAKKSRKGKKEARADDAEDPFARVGDDIRKGQERFDIADYEGAVEHWSQAYVGLPDGPDAAAFRTTLAYQIATACREAYKVNHDVEYLHKAVHLLNEYREGLGPEEEEARSSADEVLSELREQIEHEERAREAERAKSEEGLSQLRDEIRAEEERKAKAAEKAAAEARAEDEQDDRARAGQRGLKLQISGGVALGVGAAMFGVMGYALARGSSLDGQGEETLQQLGDPDSPELESIRDQGVTMNRLAIGAAVTGGVLVLTGAALLVVGSLQRKRATAFAPALGPGYAGLGVVGRF
ncbi:MAG: hypothetical protein H6713_41405 [Myxococcales bacterium]|nr:hypothetical protein [Myxococcales bacterium]